MEDWHHLQHEIQGSESAHLEGRLIVLGSSGSVACLEVPRLARQLIRHGARVQCVLSPAAADMISPVSLAWATGRPVLEKLTARCEHLELFGESGNADLLLLAPCTANTLGKVAQGLDDNILTTCATTALGSRVPVLCAPGMHAPMMKNPAVQENLSKLQEYGVELLSPHLAEGKQKMMTVPEMVAAVTRKLGPADLRGKRVLITGGPTREFLDPARCLTNPSSGLTACFLAEEAHRRGAEVSLVYGPGRVEPPSWLSVHRVVSCQDMMETCQALMAENRYDYAVAAAAVSDFQPQHPSSEKRPTADGSFALSLVPTPKVLDHLRSGAELLVSFKAASSRSDEELLAAMKPYLESGRADVVVGNSIVEAGMGFDSEHNRYLVLSQGGEARSMGPSPKRQLAVELWESLVELSGDSAPEACS